MSSAIKRKTFFIALALALCPLHPRVARAGSVVPPIPKLDNEDKPIDVLRDSKLAEKASKEAKALADALKLIDSGKHSKARSLLAPVKSSSRYGDIALFLESQAWKEEAKEALKKGNAKRAVEVAPRAAQPLIAIEASHPYSPVRKRIPDLLAEIEITHGSALVVTKKRSTAVDVFERAFQRFFSGGNAWLQIEPVSLERYAQACLTTRGPLCLTWIKKLLNSYWKGSEEFKAIARVFPEIASSAKGTPRTYGRLTQSYKSQDLDQIAFDKALITYLEGKQKEAVAGLQQFLDEFPRSALRFRARYLLASLLGAMKDPEKAQKVYATLLQESPLSYYGLLAAIATQRDVDAFIDGTLPAGSVRDPGLQPQEILKMERAEQFLAAGANGLAALELKDFRARDTLSGPFLMYLATLNNEAGNHSVAFGLIQELINRSDQAVVSSYGLRLIFPTAYLDLIQKHAEKQKLDPVLVMSLIKQESAFESAAVSSSGASGLMQLMPFTAVDMETTIKRSDLIQADANIRVGTKYLRKLMDRYDGNIALALASYNAGPNAVARWVKEGKAKNGLLDFVESIPYKETRDYVSSIIRNHFWYSRRINGTANKTLAYFWNQYGPAEPVTPVPPQGTTQDTASGKPAVTTEEVTTSTEEEVTNPSSAQPPAATP